MSRLPFLWVCGASGVGKSSVGWEIYRQIVAEGRRAAYLDFDQIGFCRPAPADDPDNHRISAANLASMWPNFRDRGATCLIASGIVHTDAEIALHARAVSDLALAVCRLRARPDELRRRINWRGAGYGPPLADNKLAGQSPDWLTAAADHSIVEADEMESRGLGDFCIDTDALTIEQVAQAVRVAGGLPPS
jgi:hypothetical protein